MSKKATGSLNEFLDEHKGEWEEVDTPKGIRIKCLVTGHEMARDLPALLAHWNGKAFKRAIRKKGMEEVDLSKPPAAPFIIQHKHQEKMLYCRLTKRTLNKDKGELEGHINGKRFRSALTKWQEKKRRRAQKEADRLARQEQGIPVEDDEDDEEDSESDEELMGVDAEWANEAGVSENATAGDKVDKSAGGKGRRNKQKSMPAASAALGDEFASGVTKSETATKYDQEEEDDPIDAWDWGAQKPSASVEKPASPSAKPVEKRKKPESRKDAAAKHGPPVSVFANAFDFSAVQGGTFAFPSATGDNSGTGAADTTDDFEVVPADVDSDDEKNDGQAGQGDEDDDGVEAAMAATKALEARVRDKAKGSAPTDSRKKQSKGRNNGKSKQKKRKTNSGVKAQ